MKTVIILLSSVWIIAGCGGTDTSNPDSNTTNTQGMKLSSNDIAAGGNIEQDLTGNGSGESPHLTWSAIPANTDGYAVIVDDTSANNYVHWNFFVDDPNVTEIQRDASGTANLPGVVVEGTNSAGDKQYDPPFPPEGEKHTYRFCVYGLSTTTNTGIDTDQSYSNDNFKTEFAAIITGSACFNAYYSR